MKLIFKLSAMAVILLIFSCSRRYITFSRNLNKLEKGKISRTEYDSIIQTLYTIQKGNFKLDDRLKLSGAYVCKEYSDYYKNYNYKTFHFTDSSYVFKSYRFSEPLTNNTLQQTEGVLNRYTSKDGKIIIEYLLNRDYQLYNIYRYAKISNNGDTLTFYKTENLQRPTEKKGFEKIEIYIFNPNLTALPKLSK